MRGTSADRRLGIAGFDDFTTTTLNIRFMFKKVSHPPFWRKTCVTSQSKVRGELRHGQLQEVRYGLKCHMPPLEILLQRFSDILPETPGG